MLNPAGLTYALITIALVSAMIFLNGKIRHVTNMYWFWLGIAGFAFIGVLANRYIPDGIYYWKHHQTIYENIRSSILKDQRFYNERISRAFMLDACPCFFALLMISLIADPSRRMARIFAPIALIGGITALGTIITQNNIKDENAMFSAWYIFFGNGFEKCFFIMHGMQVIIAIGVLLNTPTSGGRVGLTSIGSFVIYLCYVGIVMAISGCSGFCTGLAMNDYMLPQEGLEGGGQYHIVIEVLHLPRKFGGACPIILLSILAAMGVLVGGVAHDYVFTSKGIGKYGNARSKKGYQWYDYNKFVKPNKAWG